MKRLIARAPLAISVLFVAVWQIACGGGSSTPPPSDIAVSVSPGSASVDFGMTQQFTASVTGTSDTAVTWTANGGTITPSGLFTAPLNSSAKTISVIATSIADPTKSSSAKVTLAGRQAPSGSWQFTGPNGGGTILSLAQDQSHPGTIYAGTLEGGLFKSLDGGNSWHPQITNTSLDGFAPVDLALESSGSVIYTCSAYVFGKSSDGGMSWTTVPLPARANSMGVDPFHTSTIYLSVPGFGVLKSTDAGDTWSVLPGSPAINSVNLLHSPLVTDPVNQGVIYYGTDHGLYVSRDSGQTWAQTTAGIATADVGIRDVAFAPGGSSIFALAGDPTSGTSDLYESSDGGNTWVGLATGLDGERVLPDPVNTGVVYLLGFQVGVYKSTDGGHTFVASSNGMPGPGMSPPFDFPSGTLISVAGSPNTFLASVGNVGLFRSGDAAATWTPASNGLSAWDGSDLDVDPSSPNIVYLAAEFGGIFKSTDSGVTWTNLIQTFASGIAVDPFDGLHLVAIFATAMNSGQPYETHDGGTTWQPVSLPIATGECFFNSTTFNPIQKGNILLSCSSLNGEAVLQSTDGGKTYAITNTGMADVTQVWSTFVNPLDPAMVFASTNVGIFKSVDGGNSWVQKLSISLDSSPSQISMDARSNPPVLYASGGWKSTDLGETWQPVLGAETSSGPMLLADPSTAGSVFDLDRWSPDEGSTWFHVLEGGGEVGGSIGRMVVAKTSPQVLFVPSVSHSVLRFVVGP